MKATNVKVRSFLVGLIATLSFASTSYGQVDSAEVYADDLLTPIEDGSEEAENFLDSEAFNPADPNAEAILQMYDQYYEYQTGLPSHIDQDWQSLFMNVGNGCGKENPKRCKVYVNVSRSKQRMTVYRNGEKVDTWKVSTGKKGFGTPYMNQHPNGRVYEKYDSKKYPDGDYKGLGNMPYAVFITGGYAIHGTGATKRLGRPASHGCIRLHPDNAKRFNSWVKSAGRFNVWITVD